MAVILFITGFFAGTFVTGIAILIAGFIFAAQEDRDFTRGRRE